MQGAAGDARCPEAGGTLKERPSVNSEMPIAPVITVSMKSNDLGEILRILTNNPRENCLWKISDLDARIKPSAEFQTAEHTSLPHLRAPSVRKTSPVRTLVIAYAVMTVGIKAGLLSPRASRMVLAIARRNGKTSTSIEPIAPEKRDPPKHSTSCDVNTLTPVVRLAISLAESSCENAPYEKHRHGLDLKTFEATSRRKQ